MKALTDRLTEGAAWVEANARYHFNEHQKHDPLRQSLDAAAAMREAATALSALEPQKEEAVAWRWTTITSRGVQLAWQYCAHKPTWLEDEERFIIEPLYANPVQKVQESQTVIEAMVDRLQNPPTAVRYTDGLSS